MGQALGGTGRFGRLVPGHFASGGSFPAEHTSWAVAAAVASAGGCLCRGGWRELTSVGDELWDRVRADGLLQLASLAVFLCSLRVGKRWFYCFFTFFFFNLRTSYSKILLYGY